MPSQGEPTAYLEGKGETLNYFEQGHEKIRILYRKIDTEDLKRSIKQGMDWTWRDHIAG